MRETKFRVWWQKQIRHNAIVGNGQAIFIPNATGEYKWVSVSECSPMQFVNLNDKNGIEIYEGDILKRRKHLEGGKDYVDYNCEVKWGKWCYILELLNTNTFFGSLDSITARECEIIGNVYEKPISEQNPERSVATKSDQGTKS